MRRWEIHPRCGYPAAVLVATLGLLAPAVVHAAATPGATSITGYTFKQYFRSDGPEGATGAYQSGDVNNKGQFCGDPGSPEREVAFDGTNSIILSDASVPILAPDGATINNSVWSPQGINNNGIVVWTADIGDGGTGTHYVMTYDLNKKGPAAYTIIARPGDPAPGGGTYPDQSVGPGGRVLGDINDLNQIAFTTARTGSDGYDHDVIYFIPDITNSKQGTVMVDFGMKTTDGKTIQDAWWPDINNKGEVTFTGTVDGTTYGIYKADGKSITPIFPAGSTIDGVTIGSARWARTNNNGDVVATVDVNGADQGQGGEGSDDVALAVYFAADKSVHLIVKPGDKIPGGVYHGQEASRRTQGITDSGQVFFQGVRDDVAPDGTSQGDGIYRWDPATNTIDALMLGNTTVPGLGKVGGVTKNNSGCSGYHMGVSGDGHVLFDAVVDDVEGYLVATPPKP